MKKKPIIFSLIAGVSLVAAGTAIAQKGHGKADANDDGVVTKEEMLASVQARFARMDANGDGVVNRADRDAKAEQRFAKQDANGDGEVSLEEMQAARAERAAKRFARLDTDNSGGISQEEMAQAKAKRGGPDGRGPRADGRRGGRDGGEGRGRRGGRGLERADTNGDKAISYAELEAHALKRFERLDADSDGRITAEERKAAREKRGRGDRGGAR